MHTKDALSWFEIPAADLPRATRFYEAVLARRLKAETMGSETLSVFAHEEAGVGGCLFAREGHKPEASGTVVYLCVAGLDEALQRVGHAGGKVALAKTALPGGLGFFAHIVDSEGNRVGLHARQ